MNLQTFSYDSDVETTEYLKEKKKRYTDSLSKLPGWDEHYGQEDTSGMTYSIEYPSDDEPELFVGEKKYVPEHCLKNIDEVTRYALMKIYNINPGKLKQDAAHYMKTLNKINNADLLYSDIPDNRYTIRTGTVVTRLPHPMPCKITYTKPFRNDFIHEWKIYYRQGRQYDEININKFKIRYYNQTILARLIQHIRDVSLMQEKNISHFTQGICPGENIYTIFLSEEILHSIHQTIRQIRENMKI
jgi:hypothetical protein